MALARALISLDRCDEAEAELESVLRSSPDNLSAARSLAEIQQRRDQPAHPPGPDVLREQPGSRLAHALDTPPDGTTAATEAVLRELE